jgi:hypothetical protein
MAEPPTGGITITRVFDASREHVWKEWTEPERFADWFGGSESEVPLSSVSMDVQPGGSWRLTDVLSAKRTPGRRGLRGRQGRLGILLRPNGGAPGGSDWLSVVE